MSWCNPLLAVGLAALPLSFVGDDEAAVRDEAPAAREDAASLVRKLGDKDYKTRKAAFRALEKLGERARSELEKAEESDDPEVRFSASLLLDRLDESQDEQDEQGFGALRDRGFGQRRLRSLDMPDDAVQEMREAMRRLEAWHGQLGLRLLDDPFHRFDFGAGENGIRLGPGSSFSRMTENGGVRESLSLRVDQDGRVTVEQRKGDETQTFEADSLDALKEQHPELLEGLGDVQVRVTPFGRGRMLLPPPVGHDDQDEPRQLRDDDSTSQGQELRPRVKRRALERPSTPDELPPPPAPAEDSPKPRLGVQVQEVNPDVAAYLELEEGVGLEVVRVVEGSAAAKLGVRVRDILTEVNGRTIRDVQDVAAALEKGDPARARITVLRRGQEKTLESRDVK